MNSQRSQEGAALLVTIILMLALTAIALASASSNQMQLALLHANQQGLSTFNAAFAEIDAQIDHLNTAATTERANPLLIELVEQSFVSNTQMNQSEVSVAPILKTNSAFLQKQVLLGYQGRCVTPTELQEEPQDEPWAPLLCHRFMLTVQTSIPNTSVASLQQQSFNTLLSDKNTIAKATLPLESAGNEEGWIEGWVERIAWIERN